MVGQDRPGSEGLLSSISSTRSVQDRQPAGVGPRHEHTWVTSAPTVYHAFPPQRHKRRHVNLGRHHHHPRLAAGHLGAPASSGPCPGPARTRAVRRKSRSLRDRSVRIRPPARTIHGSLRGEGGNTVLTLHQRGFREHDPKGIDLDSSMARDSTSAPARRLACRD